MTDSKQISSIPNSDFLIRGSDYLASKKDFKLVGRDAELKDISTVLMRRSNNNVVVHGQTGVGVSSTVLGLQASKDDLNTPFDIVGKRLYWLDTDALFSSGDATKINEGFQKAMATLTKAPDTVLIIEDVKDFLDGTRNTGTTNLINGLMRELRNKRFQAIFECRDENLQDLFKCHSDVAEIFSFNEIQEPGKDVLKTMLQSEVKGLEAYHGVKISDEAVEQVLTLTAKYPGLTLNTAQPKRSCMILEGALTAFRYKAHTRPMELDTLEQRLAVVTGLVDKTSTKTLPEFDGKSPEELLATKIEITEAIAEINKSWEAREKQIRKVYADQRGAEEHIRSLEEQIVAQKDKEEYTRKAAENFRAADGDAAKEKAVREDFFNKYGESLPVAPVVAGNTGASGTFDIAKRMSAAKLGKSEIVQALENERAQMQAAAAENGKLFKELTKGDENLVLTGEQILGEFSKLSRIPMSKLQQNESEKLLKLEETLMERVYGQDEPVKSISKSVRRGRKGLKKANKPIGSFLFLGPSGVGKTELAKALAAALFGDEGALQVYDMSEYQEKHAGAVLIGAPPGYEGYEAGGVLTNNMRRKPYCVNVFDEVEKAHKDVFDLFLQILDEGRLTDRRGIPASFGNAINIMTSNIGAKYFLDETLEWDDAKKKALKDLWDPEVGGFRPEFLNRFTGIFCFNRLGLPQIELIAGKSLKELNGWIADQGLQVYMSNEDKAAMCKDKYLPKNGGRGIMNYIEENITSEVAEVMLKHEGEKGVLKVSYDKDAQAASMDFIPADQLNKPAPTTLGPANGNVVSPVAASASAAFKPGKSA